MSSTLYGDRRLVSDTRIKGTGVVVSDLNADKLDGFHASITPGAATIPVSGGGGNIANDWLSAAIARVTDISGPTVALGTALWGIPGVISAALTTNQSIAGTIYYYPIQVVKAVTITKLGVRNTTSATASGKVRVGIYNADSAWQPTTLVSDAGELAVDGAAGAVPTGTLSIALPVGNYLLCMHADASATQATFQIALGSPLTGSMFVSTLNQFRVLWRKTLTYAVLADPGVAWDTSTNSSSPLFYAVFAQWTPT